MPVVGKLVVHEIDGPAVYLKDFDEQQRPRIRRLLAPPPPARRQHLLAVVPLSLLWFIARNLPGNAALLTVTKPRG